MKVFPAVTPMLLEALEAAFPDKLPLAATIDPRELSALVGQQNVIRFLRAKHDAQQKHS